jgi:histidinol-phosphate aminotransferase
MEIKKMVRKEILKFQPYLPGKPIDEVRREFGIRGKIIKLASNENPFGPQPEVIAGIKRAVEGLNVYPDGASRALRVLLAKKHKISPENIVAGSGTDELIELIGKTFLKPSDEIVVSEHAFIRYKMAGYLMGCGVRAVPMKNYAHDLDAMLAAVTGKTKVVFIANPNNPTGTYNNARQLEAFLKAAAAKGGPLVIVDEAYYEYASMEKDYPQTLGYLKHNPRLVILRTFSKIHSLAGLRVGYAISSREVIQNLDRARPPFNVNSLAQVAAAAVLEGKDRTPNILGMVREGREQVYSGLAKLGLEFVPSVANFILIDVSPLRGAKVFEMLLKKGIIVRTMDEYDYPNHIRVTIGTPRQNRKFLKALKRIVGKR